MMRVCLHILVAVGCMAELCSAEPQDAALLAKGAKALTEGQPEIAAAAFEQALNQGRSANLPAESVFRIQIALNRAHIETGNFYRAQQVLAEALEQVQRIPEGPFQKLAEAELTSNWGALHLMQGRFERSKSELSEALNKLPDTGEAKTLIPTILNNLAAAETQLGAYEAAKVHQTDALERWKGMFPANHPFLIKGYANLGAVQFLSKDFRSAKASMDIAIESARVAFGDHSPMLAGLLQAQAIILKSMGLKSPAKDAEKEARRIGIPKTAAPGIFTFNAKSAGSGNASVHVVTR